MKFKERKNKEKFPLSLFFFDILIHELISNSANEMKPQDEISEQNA
jgi:hypothetical protein